MQRSNKKTRIPTYNIRVVFSYLHFVVFSSLLASPNSDLQYISKKRMKKKETHLVPKQRLLSACIASVLGIHSLTRPKNKLKSTI